MAELRRIAIVGSARIPFTRAYTGYADESNLTMLGAALSGLAEKFGLKGQAVNEVMGGAVISHSRDFNVAREAALDAGYSPRTPGTNLQIACGTSLQAALNLGAKIATGEIESGIADHKTRSLITEQVEMGVAIRMAVLETLARNASNTGGKN